MKKIIITTVIILQTMWSCFAQITLENTYTFSSQASGWGTIKLSVSGVKYFMEVETSGTDSVKLYNTNHTLFKTIVIPQLAGFSIVTTGYFSETLFNLDTLIEYMVLYQDAGGTVAHTYVYDENGIIIYQINNSWWHHDLYYSQGIYDYPIVPVGNTAKLILKSVPNGQTIRVYNLPGQLACYECNGGVLSGFASEIESPHKTSSYAFPNPSIESVTIKYTLPENCKKAWIEIFDMQGNFVKKFNIDKTFNDVILSNEDLSAGSYLYSITADNKIIEQNKFIVIKD